MHKVQDSGIGMEVKEHESGEEEEHESKERVNRLERI